MNARYTLLYFANCSSNTSVRDYKFRSHSDDKEELNTKSRSGPSGSKRSSSGYREAEVSERRHESRERETEESRGNTRSSRGDGERRQSKQWKNVATYLNVRWK